MKCLDCGDGEYELSDGASWTCFHCGDDLSKPAYEKVKAMHVLLMEFDKPGFTCACIDDCGDGLRSGECQRVKNCRFLKVRAMVKQASSASAKVAESEPTDEY